MSKPIEVWINCPDAAVAKSIGEAILEQRLAAAYNVYPPIQSGYHWKGEVTSATEVPLLVKSREELFDRICSTVRDLHPYETPSIVGWAVEYVNDDYEAWIAAETRTT